MEHLSTVAASDLAYAWLAPERLADHIRSGCVYDEQAPDTFGLLVTRADPRTRRGTKHGRRQVRAPIHAHWPLFAPSVALLTGHETTCRARHCHGVGRCAEHASSRPPVSGWPAFAAAYRAELEEWPFHTRLAAARHLAAWLRTYPTVTILCFEDRISPTSTQEGWAQRHIFRE